MCTHTLDQFDIINGLNDEKQISKLNYLTQDDQYEKNISNLKLKSTALLKT